MRGFLIAFFITVVAIVVFLGIINLVGKTVGSAPTINQKPNELRTVDTMFLEEGSAEKARIIKDQQRLLMEDRQRKMRQHKARY